MSEEELVLLVLCNTWTFLLVPPPPVYVPVTLATLSDSALSPIWTVTPDLILAADKLVVVTPLMVCVPVRYRPLFIVWSDALGYIVCAACVVTDAVSDTELFPAVPLLTYPAVVTLGVTLTVLDNVSVFVPVLTVADVPVIEAGAVTVPLATAFDACDS